MCWNFFKCENIAWIRISKKDLENEWISCRVMTLCGRLWYCSQFYSMHSMKSNHKWAKKVAKQYFLEKHMFVVTVTQQYSFQLLVYMVCCIPEVLTLLLTPILTYIQPLYGVFHIVMHVIYVIFDIYEIYGLQKFDMHI